MMLLVLLVLLVDGYVKRPHRDGHQRWPSPGDPASLLCMAKIRSRGKPPIFRGHNNGEDISRLHNRSPVAGIGDEAAWSSDRVGTMVADGLDVRSGPYVVEISFLGSPKAPPTGADDLNRARALALRALANAKANRL
ncbi:MAG TPA: hypothetical protein VMU81_09455 [Acetobacteraceae bacterium]|nr:hypothetical protein [Acetobacteraceae bacterium]